MKILNLEIDNIFPYEKNPRKNDEAVNVVAKSLEEFGFQQPLVLDADNVIVVGHTRFRAAKKLGLETVPCVVADNLTVAQVKAYRIKDNKSSELSKWDYDLLTEEMSDLLSSDYDLSLLGFDNSEIEAFLNAESLEYDFQAEGVKEILESDFNMFDRACPRCGFEFNDKK